MLKHQIVVVSPTRLYQGEGEEKTYVLRDVASFVDETSVRTKGKPFSRFHLDAGMPAYDCNCTMFATPGDITVCRTPYTVGPSALNTDCDGNTKAVIFPNRSVAIFGDSVEQTVMRAIYFNNAVSTLRNVAATGGSSTVLEASGDEIRRQNEIWNENSTFRDCPEIKLLEKRMSLPM